MPKAKAFAATPAPEPPPPEPVQVEEEVPPEEPKEEEPVRDHPRGYVGWIYEDTFKELYQPPKAPAADATTLPPERSSDYVSEAQEDVPKEGSAEDLEEETARPAVNSQEKEVDLSAEDAEIAMLQAQLSQEDARLSGVLADLHSRHTKAAQDDAEEAQHLQKRWGLTQREQYPVGDSKLRAMLDPKELKNEGLVHPAGTLRNLERKLEIQKGTVPQHENRLAVSKPEEPNHFKLTAAQKNRMQTANIQPTLTEQQRATIAESLEERGRRLPPAPPFLNAEEREKNREIVKRMREKVSFLRNPRFEADRGGAERGEASPFAIRPESVVFRNYEVGGVYELDCEFRNTAQVGRRLRVLPCANPCFSIDNLRYDGDAGGSSSAGSGAIVAPGMAARLKVRFAPRTLNDETEELVVGTEVGDFKLPLLARRVQPKLEVHHPVDCGCVLAGNSTERSARLTNHGGEGSFRLIPAEDAADLEACSYQTLEDGQATLSTPAFSVTPAAFFLEAGKSVDLHVHFAAPDVGRHHCHLLVECDNGVKTPLELVGITDAVRLELARWPTLERPLRPQEVKEGVSPWSYVPWRLDWLDPGAQVGGIVGQSIVLANGGYMPIKVQWRLARPPAPLQSRLAVGDQPRLTQDLLDGTRLWSTCPTASHGSYDCPFSVEPKEAEVQPFGRVEFAFHFHAHAPAGRRAMAFACLEAVGLPIGGQCLVHYGRLLELQEQLQPPEHQKGLPLFGGAVSGVFDRVPPTDDTGQETGSCTVTAVCLQGASVRATVTPVPPAITFPGVVPPFVSITRELRLQSAGSLDACYRVRTSASGPLWVLRAEDAGQRPEAPEQDFEPDPRLSDLKRRVEELVTQWPPLPPSQKGLPGFGAAATVVVEQAEGTIPAGGEAVLKVTIRAPRELDIDGELLVDLPVKHGDPPDVPPLAVPVFGSVRTPRVGLRYTSLLDYGVVRAHSQHTSVLKVDNPSDLPMLVRMQKHREQHSTGEDHDPPVLHTGVPPAAILSPYALPQRTPPSTAESGPRRGRTSGPFPMASHQEVVDLFASMVMQGSKASFASVPGHQQEVEAVEPWVHARSGCLEKSGKRQLAGATLKLGWPEESDDFIFRPECFVLWPRETAEVEVTLRTGEVGQYEALVEALAFDSLHTQCVEVYADVQLPRLRISSQHCHFPLTYAGTESEPLPLSLRNESDLPASFKWVTPQESETCLEVHVSPSEGSIPPRGELSLDVRAQPTRLPEGGQLARLVCQMFVQEMLQPVCLHVSAAVYGPEVDYSVVAAGELAPRPQNVRKRSKQEDDGTFQVTVGRAGRGLPVVDFGELELLKSKSMHVVLYNRTGIGTPFTARIRHYPANSPGESTRKPQARHPEPPTAMQPFAFATEPRAAPAGAQAASKGPSTQQRRSVKFDPRARGSIRGSVVKAATKKKRFLLDDKHEKQSFRSAGGVALLQQKEEQEQGMVALQQGRGWAVEVQSDEDVLQPFGIAVITLTSFCDLPGLMEDELILNIPELPGHAEGKDFRVPVRMVSVGNPLYLPEQQVGLNLTMDPPRLLCGVIVPSEKLASRRFRVGNSSSAKMSVSWKIYPKRQLENTGEERQLLTIGLCKRKGEVALLDEGDAEEEEEDLLSGRSGNADEVIPDDELPCSFLTWAQEPPEVADPFAMSPEGAPPLKIEPEEAVIPSHGTTWFSVTMFASKATSAPANHYSYKLVGRGRFAEERRGALTTPLVDEAGTEKPEQTMVSLHDTQVRNLPNVPLDATALHDSDSDAETVAPTRVPSRASGAVEGRDSLGLGLPVEAAPDDKTRVRAAKQLANEPDEGIVSTVVIDCVGDCILPRLTVDKTHNPSVEDYISRGAEHEIQEGAAEPEKLHCPVFRFVHSVLSPPAKRASGATQGGAPGTVQIPGVVSHTTRGITFSNATACNIACRFRVTGPFRVREIAQLGRAPVRAQGKGLQQDTLHQLFVVAKLETITVQVEFDVDLVSESEWKSHRTEHNFEGDLVIEYPRDLDSDHDDGSDLQRVHLVGVSKRPSIRVTVVPRMELDRALEVDLADLPPWGAAEPVVVDFGNVHVEASVTRSRVILLSNVTSILARWQLLHVGRRKKEKRDIGQTTREEEDTRALDDKDAFEFNITDGELRGPTKDGALPETKERQPHWGPRMPGVVRAPALLEEEQYEPQRIQVAFRPTRNELYKCKFRIQVESGLNVDFVCRGHGSYDEEDDTMDYAES